MSNSPYAITIRYMAIPTARQQLAVDNAIARWQTVLTRDLVDIPVNAPVNACYTGQPALSERVDDILILVEFVEIDGSGKILGEAGPCYVRSDNGLPVIADCCSSTELHGELAELLRRYDVNDYAASVKVYAVKPV